MAMNTTPKLKGLSTGKFDEDWEGSDGCAHVRPLPGPQTQSKNRSLLLVPTSYSATDSKVSWSASENITELTIIATGQTGVASIDTHYAIVTFNATSDSAASANLDLTIDSETTDVQWYKIPLNTPTVFRFTSAVLRADFLGVIVTPNIWIGAN